MGERISIIGGKRLSGEVQISGAKNAALPIVFATLLSEECSTIENVPNLEDIDVTLRLLRSFGAEANFANNTVKVTAAKIQKTVAPYALVRAMRASFLVLGPLLARTNHASVSLPGGDAIGTRPVNLHLEGLVKMGANINIQHGMVVASAPGGLNPATIDFDFPSVGATEHIMMTAACVAGETVIRGAAKEPEIIELAEFLNSMGAEVSGAGTSVVSVRGKGKLSGGKHRLKGDRIEALTFLIAAAMTAGEIDAKGIEPATIGSVIKVLESAGCKVECLSNGVKLVAPKKLKSFVVETGPYPEFPTDAQPLIMAAASIAEGESSITEKIFENRFGHVAEYRRFGADLNVKLNTVFIKGVATLSGAPVEASDIRAGAGLVLMALAAEGTSTVSEVHHLDRGYERLIDKFMKLGASICRLPAYDHRELIVGC